MGCIIARPRPIFCALSKTVKERTYVCAYLIELRPIDITGPLKEFQLTNSNKQDTQRLMKTMNAAQDDAVLSDKVFEDSFGVWWPRLEEKLKKLPPPEKAVPKSRDPESIQDEILELVRKIDRRLSTSFTLPVEAAEFVPHTDLWATTGSGKTYVALRALANALALKTEESKKNVENADKKKREKKKK